MYNLLENGMKVQEKKSYFPSQIPDLAKFLFRLNKVLETLNQLCSDLNGPHNNHNIENKDVRTTKDSIWQGIHVVWPRRSCMSSIYMYYLHLTILYSDSRF